jgi:hypothetical protein
VYQEVESHRFDVVDGGHVRLRSNRDKEPGPLSRQIQAGCRHATTHWRPCVNTSDGRLELLLPGPPSSMRARERTTRPKPGPQRFP